MKEGEIPMESAESVIMGVAGSGKTHSLAMALKEDLPSQRVSTTCFKAPIRTMTRINMAVKDEKVVRMKSSKYFDILMDTIKDIARSTPGHHPVPPTSMEVTKYAPKFVQELEEKMIRHVVDETQYEDQLRDLQSALLGDYRWNRLTDSGGQPQFLEILPVFLHHISLGIFTIKLNERLDHFPFIEYYNELGKPVGRPYKSHFTHEQILKYCMRALVSQAWGGHTKFLFLGTHLDLKDDSIGESIADKNAKLREMVNSFGIQNKVVYCNRNFDLIFAINARDPGEEDWKVMEEVREEIVECSKVLEDSMVQHIPIKWFAMELALVQFVEKRKQAVLKESTCFEMVAKFHFDQDSFKAALRYLQEIKLIFYFESMELIVADIQVFLNILSQIVRYNIELHTNPHQWTSLDYKWKKFKGHGILHTSCLKKFRGHYIKGVFSPKELLEMFTSLGIVSELGSDEYLMPCILPPEDKDLCYPKPSATSVPEESVPPMIVEFPGGTMLGAFCGLVCYLMNTAKWQLAIQRNRDPVHLTRNSIHFKAPGKSPGKVCIDDPISTFFVVSYHGKVASRVCPRIRLTILKGLENLTYVPPNEAATATTSSQQNQPLVTFSCPCEVLPLHPATMSDDGDFLTCPFDAEISAKVTDAHRIWFGGKHH